MRAGDGPGAERAFREATRLAPRMPDAYLDLGLVLAREGKLDDAIAALRQAVTLDPEIASAHMFLGIFLYQGNRPEEARKELQAELQRDPKNAEALTWLGTVDLAMNHPERAVGSLDRAAELQPDDLNVLELRGRAHSMVARDSYARMTRLDPGSWHVHHVQAQLYADEGRHAEAITEYQAAIKLEPRNPDLFEGLGDEYRSSSQLEAAEGAYQKGFTLGPANPVALYNLGSVQIERGENAEGVRLLQAMLRSYPNSPVAEYYLGRGLAELGKDEEAASWLSKSATGAGEGEVAKRSWYELARVSRRLRRTDQAQTALSNYNRLRAAEDKASSQQVQDWKKLTQPQADAASASKPGTTQ